jgi:hypothetical protein
MKKIPSLPKSIIALTPQMLKLKIIVVIILIH